MQQRQLGNTGLYVYPITFGGNVFGWTIDEKQSFEILDAFTGAGFNFIRSRTMPRSNGILFSRKIALSFFL